MDRFKIKNSLNNLVMKLQSGLYIVATPIGNLEDITLRALFVLKNCDIIYCEDTRLAQKLLLKHGIKGKKLAIYNDHSDESERVRIAKKIHEGKMICLVSDAGTPLISDPGYKLVRFLQEKEIYIDVLPGPCAAISALVLSGLPTDRFFFAGFMPKTMVGREKLLQSLENLAATIILYDAAPRIFDSLVAIEKVLGNREVAVVREMTKIFQTVIRRSVAEIIGQFDMVKTRGEFVILISSAKPEIEFSKEDIMEQIKQMQKIGKSKKDIAEELMVKLNKKITKNEIYNM